MAAEVAPTTTGGERPLRAGCAAGATTRQPSSTTASSELVWPALRWPLPLGSGVLRSLPPSAPVSLLPWLDGIFTRWRLAGPWPLELA